MRNIVHIYVRVIFIFFHFFAEKATKFSQTEYVEDKWCRIFQSSSLKYEKDNQFVLIILDQRL